MLGEREDEDKELDVDFAVVEVPFDTHLPQPRHPNVVSRRGHKVKITGYVRELKDNDTESLRIRAEVYVLGHPVLSPGAHASRRMKLWGDTGEEDIIFKIPDDADFPLEFEVIVEEKKRDEHLGQGPDYTALVTIHEDTPAKLNGENATGDRTQAADDQNKKDEDDTGNKFTINFVSM